MTSRHDGKPRIESLDPAKHDRAAFSCGVEQVDNYFKKTANKLSKADNVRIWVMIEREGGLIGFYAINAHAVDYADLPDKFSKSRPGHGQIPAAYISMIGVDLKFDGHGYGGDLLIDALSRIARVADDMGIAVVMLDVLDCGNTERVGKLLKLYMSYGFAPLPSNPLRLFLPLATVRALVAG